MIFMKKTRILQNVALKITLEKKPFIDFELTAFFNTKKYR